MALRLIYGRSGSGKTRYCLDRISAKLQQANAKPVVWLLPEHETFKMEKLLADTLSQQGFSQAYILGFRRLAYRVLNECGGALKEHITELGKNLLLSRIMNEHSKEWTAFARAVKKRNFAPVLAKLLEELKVYGVDAALLLEKTGELPATDGLKDKLTDLAMAYKAMQEKMADVYQDNEDCMSLLIDRLPKSQLSQQSEIFIDDFRFFNPQELAVIRVLMQSAANITITLCIDNPAAKQHAEETDIFHRQYKTRNQLLKLAKEYKLTVEEIELTGKHRTVVESLQKLEGELYKYNAKPAKASTGVRIIEAANRRREVEAVAADILRLRREKAYCWHDITVLIRDGDAYFDTCEMVLRDYEIPFFNERRQAVLHHPLAELLRSLLEGVSSWSYEPLFRMFKTGFFPATAAEIDALENYVLACGIRGNKWLEEEAWQYKRRQRLAGDKEQAELVRLNEIRWRVITPLAKFKAKLGIAESLQPVLAAIYELLEELNIPAQLEQAAAAAEKAGCLAEAGKQRQIWDGIITLLDEMADISGTEKLSQDSIADLINDGLDSLSVSLIPPGLDYVALASFDQNNAANTKAVYIIGLNDGLIPRKAKTEGILNDSDRCKLAELGVELPDGTAADNFGERFLIYSAFSRAAEYMVFTYALADQNGDALLPSSMLTRLQELLPVQVESIALETAADREGRLLGKPKRSLAYLTEVFGSARKNAEPVPFIWQAVYNWGRENGQAEQQAKLLAGLVRKPKQQELPTELAKLLYMGAGQRLKGSVTRFEEFQKCPFRHFADYGLRLQERDIFDWQVNELGSFMHEILRRFGETIHSQGRSWGEVTESECRELCHELVGQIAPQLKNEILLSSAYYKHLLERIEKAALKSLLRLIKLDKNSEFHPMGYEKSFGTGKEYEPLTYKLTDGSILEIRGQIDRMDNYQDEAGNVYLVIIDYKTGSIGINLLEVYYGLRLQLLTYLLVAYNELQKRSANNIIPAGMLYCFLKNQPLSLGGRKSAAEIEKEIDKALKMPGWILADKELISKFDGLGRFLPVSLDRKGEFTKASEKCIKTEEELRSMLFYIDKIMTEAGDKILAGDITVSPYSLESRNACEYCQFGAICQFDTVLGEGSSRVLPKLNEQQAAEQILAAIADTGRMNV